jgi:hypothetical protein
VGASCEFAHSGFVEIRIVELLLLLLLLLVVVVVVVVSKSKAFPVTGRGGL